MTDDTFRETHAGCGGVFELNYDGDVWCQRCKTPRSGCTVDPPKVTEATLEARLRGARALGKDAFDLRLLLEAADEIERLRAEVAEYRRIVRGE